MAKKKVALTLEDAAGDSTKLGTISDFLKDPGMKEVTPPGGVLHSTNPLLEVNKTALGLRKRVTDLEGQIRTFARIATAEEYTIVAEYGREANRIIKEAEEFYEPEVKQLYRLWKDKTEERALIVNPAEAIKSLAQRLTAAYQQEQERLRLEEQRRLEEEARKQAEEETLAAARALELEGRHEEAEALVESPYQAAPVVVTSFVPKVAGVSSKPRDNWQVEVTDLKLLVKAVAAGKVPIQAIQANESWLNKMASVMKQEMTRTYPGIRVVNRAKVLFRS
jgi:hypothetical protein